MEHWETLEKKTSSSKLESRDTAGACNPPFRGPRLSPPPRKPHQPRPDVTPFRAMIVGRNACEGHGPSRHLVWGPWGGGGSEGGTLWPLLRTVILNPSSRP